MFISNHSNLTLVYTGTISPGLASGYHDRHGRAHCLTLVLECGLNHDGSLPFSARAISTVLDLTIVALNVDFTE